MLATTAIAGASLPDRAVELHGTRNTRQLGGIPVAIPGSRTLHGCVRRGMIFRSGNLSSIAQSDVTVLQGFGLKTVLDFRMPGEIKHEGLDRASLRQSLAAVDFLPMDPGRGGMKAAYDHYINNNDESLRRTFEILSHRETYPVLYHCSAGKDRTGIVSALLLELLGASRADIMDDYLQSERNSAALRVKEDWLNEVFAREDAAGGTEKFLLGIGVTGDQIASIRSLLIESAPLAQTP